MDRFVNAILSGFAEGATYGLVALGIVLVYKATRVLNFAQAEIGTMCIYVAWLLTTIGVPIGFAVVVAVTLAAVLGAVTEVVLRPLSNAPPLTITVATLGIATVVGYTQIVWFGPDPHNLPALIDKTLQIGATAFAAGRILAMVLTLALGIGLFLFFKRTLFGLGVLAAAQDQTALKLQGLPFNRVSMFTWATGTALTALAGLVLAPTIGSFTPFFITTSVLIPSLGAALVGGLTSLPGAFVGGLTIGIVQNFARFYLSDIVPGPEFVAVYIAMAAILLFRPRGLLGSEA